MLGDPDPGRAGRRLTEPEHGLVSCEKDNRDRAPKAFAQCRDGERDPLVSDHLLDIVKRDVTNNGFRLRIFVVGELDAKAFADQRNACAGGGKENGGHGDEIVDVVDGMGLNGMVILIDGSCEQVDIRGLPPAERGVKRRNPAPMLVASRL